MLNPIVYIPVVSEPEEETKLESFETEEEDSEEEQEPEWLIPVMESPRVLSEKESEKGREGRFYLIAGDGVENSQGNEWSPGDIDVLFCPILYGSLDYNRCLPCGHIFGSSCIRKWLQRGSCPQCNRKCTLKDVRKLFASRVVAIDGESRKRIQFLEAKCISLKRKTVVSNKKQADWRKKEAEWKKREAAFELELHQFKTTPMRDKFGRPEPYLGA